jgi:hypothetical protein
LGRPKTSPKKLSGDLYFRASTCPRKLGLGGRNPRAVSSLNVNWKSPFHAEPRQVAVGVCPWPRARKADRTMNPKNNRRAFAIVAFICVAACCCWVRLRVCLTKCQGFSLSILLISGDGPKVSLIVCTLNNFMGVQNGSGPRRSDFHRERGTRNNRNQKGFSQKEMKETKNE